MFGVELSPVSAIVRPLRVVMFDAIAPCNGSLAGVLVGTRRGDDEWAPAVGAVTIDAVLVHGVKAQGLLPFVELDDGNTGWRVTANVRSGQTLAVYIRNDLRELRELRAVLVMHGKGSPGPPRTGHTQRRIGR